MIPFLRSTVLAFADILGAVAETGVRAHAGYLTLAEVTNSLLQARPGPLVSQHKYLALSASSMLSVVVAQVAKSISILGLPTCTRALVCRYWGRGRSAAQPGARAACLPSTRGSS